MRIARAKYLEQDTATNDAHSRIFYHPVRRNCGVRDLGVYRPPLRVICGIGQANTDCGPGLVSLSIATRMQQYEDKTASILIVSEASDVAAAVPSFVVV